ncbi:hypothetical protein D2Q93_08755 [Alicyclobacillaceae bacterium I2511]|nr:hypothetical protein D2Q93_08755 [Alicyclobacillaceae bacterium I2511]
MYHPLYYQAVRLRGQPVYVQHVNGRVYRGTLMSVLPHGVYLMPRPTQAALMSDFSQSDVFKTHPGDVELIYSPVSYFAFGALAGLGVAALAAPLWW